VIRNTADHGVAGPDIGGERLARPAADELCRKRDLLGDVL